VDADTVSLGDGIPEDAVELLILDQLPSVGLVTIRRLTSAFGSARAALSAPPPHFGAIAGPVPARERYDPRLRVAARTALDRAIASGAKVVTWNCALYPEELHQLSDPPPLLFVRGREELLNASGVSVVGARRATHRGRDIAERLGRGLARAGVSVVSGLALGVDGAAHAGALQAEGDTVAVLGTGTDVVYPRRHRRLFDAILDRGLLVSEFPPGTRAAPFHFPRRNRILAALSSTTVVVEAGRRSGALITVDHALDLGREVWAVPGPIEHAPAAGSNRLLADGARALVSVEDFVAAVSPARGSVCGPTGEGPTGEGARDTSATSARPSRSDDFEAAVLAALSDQEVLLDDLAARVAIPVGTTLAVLTTLELYGEVERLPGMRFRRAA
jgi:DNA processing protein